MSFKFNETNTRRQVARFSVDEWIAFRDRYNDDLQWTIQCERDKKILYEIIFNNKTTAQLGYLAKTDNNYNWLKSNQGKPMSCRRIQQILTKYYPEFHIWKTHRLNRKDQKLRNKANLVRNKLIKENAFCGWCGATEKLDLHHMLPIFLGGTSDERNLIFLCEKCHAIHTQYIRSLYGNYGGGGKIAQLYDNKENNNG